MYTITSVYALAAFLAIGGLLQGFDVSSMSGIISYPPFKEYCGHPDANVTGGITASISGASFLGCFVAFVQVDRLGRRTTAQIACVLFVIGAVLSAASVNVAMLIVGRIFSGTGVGMLTSSGPVYLAELCRKEIRGRVLSLQPWASNWGALTMYFVAYGAMQTGTTAGFRIPWGVQAAAPIVLFTALFFFPQSPRWLASQDRPEECLAELARLHGHGDPDAPLVQAEYMEIQEAMATSRALGAVQWSELVQRDNLQRIMAGIFIHVWTQLSGNNAILFYVSYVFQMSGLTGNISLIAAGVQYAVQVVCTLPAIIFLDRLGRRPALMIGSALMAVFLYSTAATMATNGHYIPGGLNGTKAVSWVINEDAHNAQRAVIACTYLLVAAYSCTWNPIGWAYPPEIFPQRLRGKAVAVATSANWIFAFANNYYTPSAFQNLQWRTFLIFGTFNIAAGIHVFFLFPETRGRSLEDMDAIFASGVRAWRTKSLPDRLDLAVDDAK
ncbi:sugar transporter [Sporothrix brasiliensis 5110]|uniref:Sugar transporter n=1 Tax=Sporothrix brasiliensis 5110 TaxID=1398154 RepID=A0A0C2ICM6_9PEZI|nr:sugar transporter [Sporothrix brasiliensis 5110]KIH87056.1 sugar transporter [Sporothrix brasiliensis 5110]